MNINLMTMQLYVLECTVEEHVSHLYVRMSCFTLKESSPLAIPMWCLRDFVIKRCYSVWWTPLWIVDRDIRWIGSKEKPLTWENMNGWVLAALKVAATLTLLQMYSLLFTGPSFMASTFLKVCREGLTLSCDKLVLLSDQSPQHVIGEGYWKPFLVVLIHVSISMSLSLF